MCRLIGKTLGLLAVAISAHAIRLSDTEEAADKQFPGVLRFRDWSNFGANSRKAKDGELRDQGSCGGDQKVFRGGNAKEEIETVRCPCLRDPRLQFQRKPALHTRFDIVAKSPEGAWKAHTPKVPKWKKIYYINLDKSTLRRQYIENQLKKHSSSFGNIPYERFRGTDPFMAQHFDLSTFSNKGLMDYVAKLPERAKWGTIGTYLSHLRVLQDIYKKDPEGDGLYVILEDDVTLVKGWRQHVEEAFTKGGIPMDWDMLKFGYWGGTRCQDSVSPYVFEARGPAEAPNGQTLYNGNLGYIVRPKSIPHIFEQVRSIPIYDVDGVFFSMHMESAPSTTNNVTEGNYTSWGAHTYYLKTGFVKGGTGGQGMATERLGGGNANYVQRLTGAARE